VVNLLTMNALETGIVKVLGGEQMRPNIHIEDMTDLYLWMLDNPWTGVFNAGFENMAVKDIARMVAERVRCRTVSLPSNDPRSYRQDSTRLLLAGFKPKRTVQNAIDEIIDAYRSGKLRRQENMVNLQSMPRKAA
jgi:nucleoside-diphosphate-sugar epimerase